MSINLVKTSAITVGVAAGILSVTHPQLELKSGRVTAQIAPQQPNVVVIMTDDLSAKELNVVLNKGWMPNLKNYLINKGTTFTQSFVTNPVCCPSRSTFLTGQYSHNHGVLNNYRPNGGVTAFNDNSTLATWLKQAGYRTCLIGKYLNEYGSNATASLSDDRTYVPPGWDDWQALFGNFHYLYNYLLNDNGKIVNYGANSAKPPEEYQTDVLAQRSVNFINESEAIDDSKPFFLFVTPPAPHLNAKKPIEPAPRHKGSASQVLLPQKPSFNEQDVSDKPSWVQNKQLTPEKIAEIQKTYRSRLEAMRAVDDLIGRVVTVLVQNGELKNTVLIFTSDNGYLFGEHRLIGKSKPYEESIRVPLYIRTPEFSTKQSVSQIVLNNDLAPTIAKFAGATPTIPVDGRSLIPLLRNPSLANWRQRFLIQNSQIKSQSYSAIRTSRVDTGTPNQLYVKYLAGNQEFYDLAKDPYQLQSLHNETGMRQQQIQTLQNRLANLKVCKGQNCQILEGN